MSREEVKFTKMSRWNVRGKVETFEEGDVGVFDSDMADEMVTHNYAEYTDPTKAVKVEENKAIESVEDVKEAKTPVGEQTDEGAVEQEDTPEAEEEVKPEVKKSAKKKKGKKSSKK